MGAIMSRCPPGQASGERPSPGINEDEANVNDSLKKLYIPPMGEPPDADIIFFHGLQLGDFEKAYWKTWLSTDNQTVWPQEWLPLRFPRARIFSVSYNSSATQLQGQMDMYNLGGNLVSDIISSDEYPIGQANCPVFLVGHSLGGIVIKQFILSAVRIESLLNPNTDARKKDRINAFLGNVKGVFYYATPHAGSRIADLAHALPYAGPILELLRTLNTERARINEEFRRMRDHRVRARAYAVAEGLDTTYGIFHARVVEEASARYDINEYYTNTRANHFTVCKATGPKDSSVIVKLVTFIKESVDDGQITYNQQFGDTDAKLL